LKEKNIHQQKAQHPIMEQTSRLCCRFLSVHPRPGEVENHKCSEPVLTNIHCISVFLL